MNRKKAIIQAVLLLFFIQGFAQQGTIFGKWKTIDDETGEAKSTVEIYKKGDKVFGKVVAITDETRQDEVCSKCKGAEKNVPVIGLNIIKDLEKDGDEYSGGTIFDPEKGKKYTAKLWLDKEDPSILHVRGYIAVFYRTQNWIRVE
ncbi:DUF2147 domain-containing protein [uncultured Dokdonia sp.]|uniref:DUF2147 domain-containing protein n=1 Tax=uncultured Dokdonia sp. TaxID=575653 RepID=UPI0026335F00|nr:DUF2147 domain-containing protein [uncultured Dokdonia sp.]